VYPASNHLKRGKSAIIRGSSNLIRPATAPTRSLRAAKSPCRSRSRYEFIRVVVNIAQPPIGKSTRHRNRKSVNSVTKLASKSQTETHRITFIHQISENTSLKSSPDTITRVSNTKSQHNHNSEMALHRRRRACRTQQPAGKPPTNGMPSAGFFEYFQNSADFSEIS